MAGTAAKVYAIDVCDAITARSDRPANFELAMSDGTNVPVPAGSVDLAYSNQLMEHMHSDDAASQLGNIARALRPGGRYICLTPHRLQGPCDVSQFFDDDVATGFHLKEYTYAELDRLFYHAGF